MRLSRGTILLNHFLRSGTSDFGCEIPTPKVVTIYVALGPRSVCLNSGHSNRILRYFWRNFKFMT